MKSLLLGMFLFGVAQSAVWYQTNGQFISPWMKDNPIIMSFMGVPISFAYIWATTYIVEYCGGDLWPSRLMGYRELFKHNDKLYIIKQKALISHFVDKQEKLHLDLVKEIQNYYLSDHTLKTDSHFLFVETVEETEFEELCPE